MIVSMSRNWCVVVALPRNLETSTHALSMQQNMWNINVNSVVILLCGTAGVAHISVNPAMISSPRLRA